MITGLIEGVARWARNQRRRKRCTHCGLVLKMIFVRSKCSRLSGTLQPRRLRSRKWGGTPQKGYFDAENDDKTAQFRNPFVACLTAEVAGDISHKWDIIKDTLSFLKAHGANMCRHPGWKLPRLYRCTNCFLDTGFWMFLWVCVLIFLGRVWEPVCFWSSCILARTEH